MMIIMWDNAAQKAAGMAALAARVGTHHTYDWADDVAEAGKQTIEGIAREDTGYMRGSVSSRATAMGGVGVAEAGYGVASYNAPFYTKFQEYGTRHGITPMLSVEAGAAAMEVAADNAGLLMLGRIKGEWDAI